MKLNVKPINNQTMSTFAFEEKRKGCLLYSSLIIAFMFVTILLFTTKCNAQPSNKQPNAIYLAFQPRDLGVGVRYDHSFNGVGAYTSITYGNYNIAEDTYIKDHIKSTIGISIPMRDYMTWHYAFNAAINYHIWGDVSKDGLQLDSKIFNPWSFELGLSVKMAHFAIGLRTDIMRWEPCVDIGIPFKYKR